MNQTHQNHRMWTVLSLIILISVVLITGIGTVSASPAGQNWFVSAPFGKLETQPSYYIPWSFYNFGYTPGCHFTACLRAEFVRDVTIPDGSFVTPGRSFTKTWRIRNGGTCTWTTDFSLVEVSGSALGTVKSVRLPHSVAPGKTVDISVQMMAPYASGVYQSNWMLTSPRGNTFGVGCNGQVPVWASVTTGYGYQVPAPVYTPIYNPTYVTPTYPTYPYQQPVVTNNSNRNPHCNNKIRSINDITFRDGSKVAPNELFRKTWTMKNGGTCIWDQGYTLIFSGGDAMGGQRIINLPKTVYPGETVQLSIDLQAPSIPGRYRGYYMLRDSLGYTFGYGSYANSAFWVDIVVDKNLAPKTGAAAEEPAEAVAISATEESAAVLENSAAEGIVTVNGEENELPLQMPNEDIINKSAESAVVIDPKAVGGNVCGQQHSEINFVAPNRYDVQWYLTNEGTLPWTPEKYAIINSENSANVERVTADIAVQPTQPGEETRISFSVEVKDPKSMEPVWTKFHLDNEGYTFCDVYFPLN